jgi:uncharacterized protein YeaO (DUF488 family)
LGISLKRIYEKAEPKDGYRVLVDRLWPRGISKGKADIDEWIKDIAPTNDLRKAYHDGQMEWKDFRKEYMAQLVEHRDTLRNIASRAKDGKVDLVFSSKNIERNNATVLKEYLGRLKT